MSEAILIAEAMLSAVVKVVLAVLGPDRTKELVSDEVARAANAAAEEAEKLKFG